MLIKRRLSFRLFSLPLLSFYMKRKRKFSPPFEVISWPICEVERLHSLLPAWMPPINAADGQWVCVSMSSGTSQTQAEILPLPLTDWCPTIANPWQELSAIYIYIQVASPLTYYALKKKCHFMFKSFGNRGCYLNLFWTTKLKFKQKRWGAPDTSIYCTRFLWLFIWG